MRLSGFATPEATKKVSQHLRSDSYVTLPKSDLTISQIGFGTYRVNNDNENHYDSLITALQNGVNLVDTSSNYGNGHSEMLVGRALHDLITSGQMQRSEIVVVSKAGYIQGDNYQWAQQRKAEGRPFPNVVKYEPDLDHCIHPEFLADQLTRSLERLQLETLDIYLLHNPEYYLSWARRAKIELKEARAEYYRRIKMAFEHLESEVEHGRIRSYGVSSNTFPLAETAFTFSSVHEMLRIAKALRPNHHFTAIQLPMNLYETGAVTETNNKSGCHTVAYAHSNDIAVLVNRPLNAFYHDQLVRLADVLPPSYPTTVDEVSTMVDTLVIEEQTLNETWLPILQLDKGHMEQIRQSLALGQMMEGRWQGFGSYQNWRDLQAQFLVPRAQWAVQLLTNAPNLPVAFYEWMKRYSKLFNEALAAISAFYQGVGNEEAVRIHRSVTAVSPDWEANTLSQTAVRALRSTQGVSCVLVGMRQPRYVQEMLEELARPVEQKPRQEAWRSLNDMLQK